MFGYDNDSDESYDSFEYSDYEYNTLEPYNYELNNFKFENTETLEDKLLKYIQNNDLNEIKAIIPSLLKLEEKTILNNGHSRNISESGDVGSDLSNDESSDCEDDKDQINNKNKYIEIFFKNGDTPLMAAAIEGNVEILQYLLSIGFSINFKLENSDKTALLSLFSKPNSNMWGFERDSEYVDRLVRCLQILINAGADVNAKGYLSTADYGNTALHYAANNNYWEMIEILIHAGADIDSMNNQKTTALQIAASKGHLACCNILLLAGANANLVDKSGSTAADIAESKGYQHLSDTINIYCGNAQHNVRLYKTWRHFSPSSKSQNDLEISFSDSGIVDSVSLNHSSLESFCLALDAPYLVKLMEDQGVSIGDLKFMDELQLQEFGVPATDCAKVVVAMKDLNKTKTVSSSKKINFEYGRPLKPLTMLEMMGNIGEHVESIDTNLEAMRCHLHRNERFYLDKYRIVNKSTVDALKLNSKDCIAATNRLILQADKLRHVLAKPQDQTDINIIVDSVTNNELEARSNCTVTEFGVSRDSTLLKISMAVASSAVAVTLTVLFFSKRFW